MLAKRFVSGENLNIGKKSLRKNAGFTKKSDIAAGPPRKPIGRRKMVILKRLTMPKNVKRGN